MSDWYTCSFQVSQTIVLDCVNILKRTDTLSNLIIYFNQTCTAFPDTIFWDSLASLIIFFPSHRQFFGNYLWNLALFFGRFFPFPLLSPAIVPPSNIRSFAFSLGTSRVTYFYPSEGIHLVPLKKKLVSSSWYEYINCVVMDFIGTPNPLHALYRCTMRFTVILYY